MNQMCVALSQAKLAANRAEEEKNAAETCEVATRDELEAARMTVHDQWFWEDTFAAQPFDASGDSMEEEEEERDMHGEQQAQQGAHRADAHP
mmetsp:Transcript_1748/g.6406  ORF Transcript_1748/g.6406 Transcript_1748/m.6406 type:complete len:92 (-) Transcript_1748:1903-2178(-)